MVTVTGILSIPEITAVINNLALLIPPIATAPVAPVTRVNLVNTAKHVASIIGGEPPTQKPVLQGLVTEATTKEIKAFLVHQISHWRINLS